MWQLAAMLIAKPLLLPGPAQTVSSLIELLGDGGFYLDVLATLGRCAVAMLLALAAGLLLALASYRSSLIRSLLSPLVSFFKAVPVMALAIYLIFLVAAGGVPILVCFITCFPIVYTNLLTGLDSMNPGYLEMAQVYGITLPIPRRSCTYSFPVFTKTAPAQ